MTTPDRDETTETDDVTTEQAGADEVDRGTVDGPDASGSAEETVAADDINELTREELVTALQEATQERDEYLDALRRNQAEFQNYRRRTMREGSAQREKGIADVLGGLVDVVDEFELAVLASESADPHNLRKGVEMVYGKFVDVLRSFGLEKIGQVGATFDPEMHDAVQQIEGEEEQSEPVVAEVLRPGYSVGDRVIRPAMVKVRR